MNQYSNSNRIRKPDDRRNKIPTQTQVLTRRKENDEKIKGDSEHKTKNIKQRIV